MKLKPMNVETETDPMGFPMVRTAFAMAPGSGPIGIPTISMLEGGSR